MFNFSRVTLWIGGLLLAGLLHAQFENAEVLGTVRDASGGAVPKAAVALTNQDTGIQRPRPPPTKTAITISST